jgi:hypothetical protein
MHRTVRRASARARHPWRIILASAALLALTVAFQPAGGQNGPGTAPPAKGVQQAAANVPAGPLDEPLAWMYEARKSFAEVRDYTCTLVKRERVQGVLREENVIQFKAKPQPFSVYMRWLAPRKQQGQEVAFVLGRNNNKMRVHSTGLGSKVAGFVSIEPNDSRVFEHSRHSIYEAGLGNLIESTIKHWERERPLGKSQVKVAEYDYNNRRCLRIETRRTERRPEFYCYRNVLYIDKASKIPVRTENYDWPREGGSPDGELIEMFSYVNLRFNVGLADYEFNK